MNDENHSEPQVHKVGSDLAGTRILLLGGSGFVGKALRAELAKHSDVNVVYTSTSRAPVPIHPREVNLPWSIGDVIECDPCDFVIHAATPASARLNSASPHEMLMLNIQAMNDVISLARRWNNCPKVLFTSSGAVYGTSFGRVGKIPEGWTGAPSTQTSTSAYGEGKRVAELLLAIAEKEDVLRSVCARMFAFSGTHLPLDRHFALGNFVRDAVFGSIIQIRGNGQSVRSYLDQADLARWLLQMLLNGTSDFAYHVGSERAVTILELANIVASRAQSLLGRAVEVEALNQTSNLDGVDQYVPSTESTRAVLELSETISLEESVDCMLRFAVENHGATQNI